MMSKEERVLYCDPPFYKLMKVLMQNDSMSYMFIYDKESKKDLYMKEISESN